MYVCMYVYVITVRNCTYYAKHKRGISLTNPKDLIDLFFAYYHCKEAQT